MASRTLFFLSFLALLCLSPIASASKLPQFDSIYQFGDSISDTGNLMLENPTSFCSFTPYGETHFSKPTGRCSNGFLMIDFIARAFNLPLLNPYLEKDSDFTRGVNFAVAGATALNASRFHGAAPTNSSLPVQLGWFRSLLNSTCSSSSSDCKKKFESTLFLVGEVGGNDYNYAFLTGTSMTEVLNLVPDVVQMIVDAVKEVIDHGARTVIIPGNFPIGCMPIYLNNFASNDTTMYDNLGCLKPLNEFARFHNLRLQDAINELQKHNPGVAIHYGDYYSALTWVLDNAASLGFDRDGVFKPCCGNMSHPCGTGKGVEVCSDPKKRVSWDGIHLTEEAYRNMAEWLLSNIFSGSAPSSTSSPAPTPTPTHVASGADSMMSTVPLGVVVAAVLAWIGIGSKLF